MGFGRDSMARLSCCHEALKGLEFSMVFIGYQTVQKDFEGFEGFYVMLEGFSGILNGFSSSPKGLKGILKEGVGRVLMAFSMVSESFCGVWRKISMLWKAWGLRSAAQSQNQETASS